MIMPPRLRKITLIAHIVSSVGSLGAVAGFLALAIAGLFTESDQVMRSVYIVTELVARSVIVPLVFASLVTGLVQSLGTTWGVFRHYWVLAKLLLTIFHRGRPDAADERDSPRRRRGGRSRVRQHRCSRPETIAGRACRWRPRRASRHDDAVGAEAPRVDAIRVAQVASPVADHPRPLRARTRFRRRRKVLSTQNQSTVATAKLVAR